jgi:hypothetical protein
MDIETTNLLTTNTGEADHEFTPTMKGKSEMQRVLGVIIMNIERK